MSANKGQPINDGPPTAREEPRGGATAEKNRTSRRKVPIDGDPTTANLRIPLLNHADAVEILKSPSREVVILDFETSGFSFRKT